MFSRLFPTRQIRIATAIVFVALTAHVAYFSGSPMSGITRTVIGFVNFPIFLATIIPGIISGGPIPLAGAVYIAIYAVAWTGVILLVIGIWRRRNAVARPSASIPYERSSAMTDTVETTTVSSARPSRGQISQSMGGHPAAAHLKSASIVFGAIIVVAVLFWVSGPLGKVAALAIVGVGGLLFLLALGRSLGALSNGAQFYMPAVEAVEQGRLDCSYAVRGVICKGGIAVVDEVHRLIWVNGELLKFADIQAVGWDSVGSRHELRITAKTGAQPITTLAFDQAAPMRQSYARLSNTLGLQ